MSYSLLSIVWPKSHLTTWCKCCLFNQQQYYNFRTWKPHFHLFPRVHYYHQDHCNAGKTRFVPITPPPGLKTHPVRDRYSNIRRERKIFCCWAANSHQQWRWAVDQIFGWAGTRLCFNKYWLHCDEWLITLAAPRGAIFRILHYSSQQQAGVVL